ncbi:MAG: hypothetical protein FWG62_08790 [Proteobacteria bacterium]|nr:hypothetical protein [Pseudomonadota bacterium]
MVPEIINADLGSQFAAEEFVRAAQKRGAGSAWWPWALAEQLWKLVKHEDQTVSGGSTASAHAKSKRRTPDEAHTAMLPAVELAA